MKMKLSLRISTIVTPLMIVFGALASSPIAWADSNEGTCSNRMLRGDYGFTVQGQILTGPRAGPIRGVAMTHFDGQGNMSQVDHVLVNGLPPVIEWSPANGTYTVNPDCTGKAQFTFTDGRPPTNLNFVVVRQGKEIYTVVADADRATISIGTKVEPPL